MSWESLEILLCEGLMNRRTRVLLQDYRKIRLKASEKAKFVEKSSKPDLKKDLIYIKESI